MLDRQRVVATPLARRVAAAHGIDVAGVAGSGPGGRVRKADVLALIAGAAEPAGAGRADETASPDRYPRVPVSPSPRLPPSPTPPLPRSPTPPLPLPVATAMLEADAGAALALVRARAAELARLGLGLGLLARVVEAAAALLPAHPLLNARWDEAGVVRRRRVHLAAGEAEAAGAPLRWALLLDAGDLNLRGLARALARPAGDLGPATFGVVGLTAGASWISAPPPLPGTAALLSFTAPARRAVAAGGGAAVRPLVALSLSYDARLIDHSHAAAFLGALRRALEQG